jgi:exonuclease VII small subunit
MSDAFKEAKEKWLREKEKYDETVKLFESIVNVLEFQQSELNRTFSEFIIEQAKHTQKLKSSNIKQVRDK